MSITPRPLGQSCLVLCCQDWNNSWLWISIRSFDFFWLCSCRLFGHLNRDLRDVGKTFVCVSLSPFLILSPTLAVFFFLFHPLSPFPLPFAHLSLSLFLYLCNSQSIFLLLYVYCLYHMALSFSLSLTIRLPLSLSLFLVLSSPHIRHSIYLSHLPLIFLSLYCSQHLISSL